MEQINPSLDNCILCPRNCQVDRSSGQKGYCASTAELRVARAALHLWEEPCISGINGSGTVFFSGCALKCVFCQNQAIAGGRWGKIITVERLAEIFLELQAKGAHNINLVTPSHFTPQILAALKQSKAHGLKIPIVYNSSGYEKTETLKLLAGWIDIYLPDFKYMAAEIARRYAKAPAYAVYAKAAIEEMLGQVGEAKFDSNGMMQKGVIVRHLLLPGQLEDAKRIIQYLYGQFHDQIYLSIMNQFTPLAGQDFPELNRKVTEAEYEELVDYALALGVENGFIQEGETASESFIPEFNNEGV
jgi:putative pyruvate formate lyase activating enzyme